MALLTLKQKLLILRTAKDRPPLPQLPATRERAEMSARLGAQSRLLAAPREPASTTRRIAQALQRRTSKALLRRLRATRAVQAALRVMLRPTRSAELRRRRRCAGRGARPDPQRSAALLGRGGRTRLSSELVRSQATATASSTATTAVPALVSQQGAATSLR